MLEYLSDNQSFFFFNLQACFCRKSIAQRYGTPGPFAGLGFFEHSNLCALDDGFLFEPCKNAQSLEYHHSCWR